MGQPGFFDLQRRYEGLDAKGDPLAAILAAVPFELFRLKLKTALVKGGLRRGEADRKSAAGRKPWDEVLIFKVLVLQALYNLSDDQVEYQLRDRLSFMRFAGLGLEDAVPDAKTLWLYREALAKAGAVEGLFSLFDSHLKAKGYLAMGGQIIDATIVPAPRQRNSRDDNAAVKAGETPPEWEAHPAKNRQKDKDARWTKKHGRSHFGYKNHIGIDRGHGLIRGWTTTNAAAHDGARLKDVLDAANTASDVWADTAYRSAKNEAMLAGRGLVSRIHRKKPKGRPMPERTRRANARKSMVRSRVEHVFAHQKGLMGLVVRTVGIACAVVEIGWAYPPNNMRRVVCLSGRTVSA